MAAGGVARGQYRAVRRASGAWLAPRQARAGLHPVGLSRLGGGLFATARPRRSAADRPPAAPRQRTPGAAREPRRHPVGRAAVPTGMRALDLPAPTPYFAEHP